MPARSQNSWLIPLLGGFAALAVVGGLLFLLVRTRDEHPKAVAKVKPDLPLPGPENVTAPPGGLSDPGIVPATDDGTEPPEPDTTPEVPDVPEPPLVIGEKDPELDKFVAKEAKGDDAPPAKKAPFLTPISVPAAKRAPADVAAKLDAILDAKLAAAKVPASPPADDAEFLRRVYLDLVGVIPPAAKVKAFLADKSPGKRDKLIDELLADRRFGEHFAHSWHDLLVKRDPDNNKTIKTHDVFVKWLTHQFNSDKPWDATVRAMLTATGDQALVGETFFVVANSEMGLVQPQKMLGTASALFLGNQMMCAECHVHPMTPEWSQDDFWGMAAFFGRTQAQREGKKNGNNLATVSDPAAVKGKNRNGATQADGSIPIPDPRNDGKFIGSAKPKMLGEAVVSKDKVNRAFAADWFTSPKNPFFARAAVNRLWGQFLARGFIAQLDDIRPDSTPSHPEALRLLAEEFLAAKFDVKHMVRVITKTQAYQRSSKTLAENKNDEELFSHMGMKVLTPRMLFQSLGVATSAVDVPTDGVANGKVAKQDTTGQGLEFFDVREYDENPGEYTYGVPQLLKLMNAKLPPACDAAAKTMTKLGSRDEVIRHLYLTALSRYPTSDEARKMAGFVAKQSDPAKGYSAALWVLLNTAEFVNNH